MAVEDRFSGCLLGLALGDALGAPYEGNPIERAVWNWLGKTKQGKRRWTDDTQMSLDLAESLLAEGGLNPDRLVDAAVQVAKVTHTHPLGIEGAVIIPRAVALLLHSISPRKVVDELARVCHYTECPRPASVYR